MRGSHPIPTIAENRGGGRGEIVEGDGGVLSEMLSETEQQPTRVWEIAENRTHLEGFDFVPGKPMQIWHSQGRQVDRYQLSPE